MSPSFARKDRDARAPKPGDLSFQIVDQVGSLVRGQYDRSRVDSGASRSSAAKLPALPAR